MGLLSTSVSITRYRVEGTIEGRLIPFVMDGLKKNAITDIDTEALEKIAGWTTFESPYLPDFDQTSCMIGPYFVFSLRMDKKSIPSKIVKKYQISEMNKKLAESKREHLSRNEKKQIKERVLHFLTMRIPATPNVYDVLWNYEESSLWFFTNQKAANEELETLFVKSFKLKLIRLFPYTMADFCNQLKGKDRDRLSTLSPTTFTG